MKNTGTQVWCQDLESDGALQAKIMNNFKCLEVVAIDEIGIQENNSLNYFVINLTILSQNVWFL